MQRHVRGLERDEHRRRVDVGGVDPRPFAREDVRDAGADPARIDEYTELAVADPTAPGNPVPLTPEAAREMYQAAM